MQAMDKQGNEYKIGSAKIAAGVADEGHHLYVVKNGAVIGWLDVEDELEA